MATVFKNVRFEKALHCFRCGTEGPGFLVTSECGRLVDFPLCADTCLAATAEAMSGDAPPSKGPGRGRKAAARGTPGASEGDRPDAVAPVPEPIGPGLFSGADGAR